MKKLLILLIFTTYMNAFALEVWPKVGLNTDGKFSFNNETFTTNSQASLSFEVNFDLIENLKLGIEAGIEHILVDEKDYLDYSPIGGNIKFIVPQSEMDLAFILRGGYNFVTDQTTYSSGDIRSFGDGMYLGLGLAMVFEQIMLEVIYNVNYHDVSGDVEQSDSSIAEEIDSTQIKFLTLKVGVLIF